MDFLMNSASAHGLVLEEKNILDVCKSHTRGFLLSDSWLLCFQLYSIKV